MSMHKILLTVNASEDLQKIKTYIAQDDIFYADKVIDAIMTYISVHISLFPHIGRPLDTKTWFRHAVEPKFKYAIDYKVLSDRETVRIFAIYKYKQPRLT